MKEYIWPPPMAPKASRAFAHDADSGPHPRQITITELCRAETAAWGGPPVRPGTPRAGDSGYEPGREAEDDRWERVGPWLAFAVFVALCAAAGWAYACGGLLR